MDARHGMKRTMKRGTPVMITLWLLGGPGAAHCGDSEQHGLYNSRTCLTVCDGALLEYDNLMFATTFDEAWSKSETRLRGNRQAVVFNPRNPTGGGSHRVGQTPPVHHHP
jgi:hypothetical protein